MKFSYRAPEIDKTTFSYAIKRINARLGTEFPRIHPAAFTTSMEAFKIPRPFEADTKIGGVYMKDEGWSNLHQCETSPQFWVYIDGRSEVLHVKSGAEGVKFKKVLVVPKSKKVYRLF
tara:strand:- start:687 stop:1040 length:354 start_codon:yes stop_codon:yes gene_type:complete